MPDNPKRDPQTTTEDRRRHGAWNSLTEDQKSCVLVHGPEAIWGVTQQMLIIVRPDRLPDVVAPDGSYSNHFWFRRNEVGDTDG